MYANSSSISCSLPLNARDLHVPSLFLRSLPIRSGTLRLDTVDRFPASDVDQEPGGHQEVQWLTSSPVNTLQAIRFPSPTTSLVFS
ncbi:hypothetical protein AFCA_003260 [Aspergillus flavus]|nr:hypothetical protein AFCA_003260 [Aspergillus flavus]